MKTLHEINALKCNGFCVFYTLQHSDTMYFARTAYFRLCVAYNIQNKQKIFYETAFVCLSLCADKVCSL
jgi:hypothetical protein